jgi:microcystin-dependent protein
MKKGNWIKGIVLSLMIGCASTSISPTQANAAGYDPFIGEVSTYAYNFAPRGWAHCQGQLLSISQNTALFSLLGTTYGGNGQTTFALPDLRGAEPIPGVGYYIALVGVYPARD